MKESHPPIVDELLAAYRAGHSDAGNRLLQHYEPWLKVMAKMQVESRFQAKFDPADIVQQTMIEAVRAFPNFRGTTGAEFTAWLRQILTHTLAHEIRRYAGTQKRDIALERSLDETLDEASRRFGDLLPASGTSPSQKAVKNERELQLARILDNLPADYRDVLVLRHLEGLSHEEIALHLNRKPGAVRMLWVRALARLREEIGQSSE